LWAIGLTALLVATGLARRPVGPFPNRSDHAQLDAGRGWRVYDGISDDRILANAAGVTYYALFALFPAKAALVSIYGLFADPTTIVGHLDAMSGVAPGGAIEVPRDQLTRLAAQGSTTLGISFLISLVVSLWSANSGIKALFNALNVVIRRKRFRARTHTPCHSEVRVAPASPETMNTGLSTNLALRLSVTDWQLSPVILQPQQSARQVRNKPEAPGSAGTFQKGKLFGVIGS